MAYPTEAVFGVGCDPTAKTAVMRLLELKQRPVDKGLILIAANYEQLKPYIDDTMLMMRSVANHFLPLARPVTFVFPGAATTPRRSRAALIACGTSHRPSVGGCFLARL
ncbi:Sua5/YciO/YrdC/YwlC family protein [Shigella flexneri]